MVKRGVRWLFVAGLWVTGAFGQISSPSQRGTAGADVAPTRTAVRDVLTLLHQPVNEVAWEDVTLEFVCNWLASRSAVNVLPDWRGLSMEGVEADTLVSVRLRNVRVVDVLDAVLDELSVDQTLGYQGKGGILRISTRNRLNSEMIVRVYDAADIAMIVPDFRGAPRIELTAQGGGQAGAVAPLITGGNEETDDEPQRQMGDLDSDPRLIAPITVIEDTIEPLSWRRLGGEGVIHAYGDRLVVRNTIEVHEKLAGRVTAD